MAKKSIVKNMAGLRPLVGLICLSLLPFASLANERNNTSYYKGDKLIISTHFSPPWSIEDCNGAELEIINESFKAVGIDIICNSSSYARHAKNFADKKVLFASPIVKSEGDKVGAFFSERFIDYVDVVASFKPGRIKLSDLHNKNIVAYQKAELYLGNNFSKAIKKAKTYRETPGREGQMRMLQKGRVDYIVGEYNILNYLAKKDFPNLQLHVNHIVKKWDVRAASHDKKLMSKFNEGLRSIKKNGVYTKIMRKYKLEK